MSTQKRVLLIEDYDDYRKVLAKVLRRTDKFEVVDYDRCERAEQHLGACDIDIALLDVRLPGRSGDDFGKALRQKCPHVMIVLLTGEAILEPLKQAVPDCFVMRKPIDAHLLLELLNCFCSEGYGSAMGKHLADKAGPGSM